MQNLQFDDTAKGITLGVLAFILVFSALPAPIARAANAPYFSITLIAPTSNPVRRQWAQVIDNSYVSAGIDAHLVYMSFTQMLDLVLGNATCLAGQDFAPGGNNCPEPSFANGGWDASFIGNGGGTVLPDFSTQNVVLYRGDTSGEFPPTGQNYYWWVNGTYNELAQEYGTNFNATQRLSIAQQMVRIVADQRPGIIIYYPLTPYAYNPDLSPWGTPNAITQTTAGIDWQHWKSGSLSSIYVAVTGSLDAVNALPTPTQNSFYDRYLYGPVSGVAQSGAGAMQEADARAVGVYINAISNNIVTSADHLKYTVSFKAHTFFDGVQVTADDYIFTQLAQLVAATSYVGGGTASQILGTSDEFHYLNGTVDYVNNGVYQHGGSAPAGWTPTSVWTSINATAFSFTLPQPYPFANPIFTGGGAIPMHIYEQVPFSQWQNSPLSGMTSGCTNGEDIMTNPCPIGGISPNNFRVTWNTARYGGNGSYISYGPIADGAYIYHGYDPITQTGTLVKFNNYWNASGLEAMHEFGINTVYVISIPGKDAAIAGYGHPIDYLDGQYTFNKDDTKSLNSLGAKVVLTSDPANGWQEMPLNDALPIWGTGTGTPNGQQDSAHAGTYAKYVRTALSLLTPRQTIIDNLVQGLGTVGITQFYPTQGVIHGGDIYQGISPDPYNVTLALEYLAAAGYNTGYKSPFQGGGLLPIQQITVQAIKLNVPGFFLGNSFTLNGAFPVAPGSGVASWYLTLQQSADGGKSWEPVALGSATDGGAYSITFTPTTTGNLTYRVFFTGIPVTYDNGTAGPLRSVTVPGASLVESYDFPATTVSCTGLAGRSHTCAANSTDIQYSTATALNIGTYQSLFGSLANGLNNAFDSLANSTNTALKTVNNNIGSLSGQLGQTAKQSDLNALSAQVSSLNSQVTTLTDVAYAALAVAVILGLLAIFLSRRKPS